MLTAVVRSDTRERATNLLPMVLEERNVIYLGQYCVRYKTLHGGVFHWLEAELTCLQDRKLPKKTATLYSSPQP